MEYILDSAQMKAVDEYSIKKIGIPSVVLMERAAYTVSELIKARAFVSYAGMSEFVDSAAINTIKTPRVLCVCGNGNNGADGLAVARHLMQAGCQVTIECPGLNQHSGTHEFQLQKNIIDNMGGDIRECVHSAEYDYIVDAVFGVGLSRNIEGEYAEAITRINLAKERNPYITVVSVDVPSGVNASDGSIMGVAVKADITVTFGYKKLGLVLNPGAMMAGHVVVTDIGFVKPDVSCLPGEFMAYTYDLTDVANIPGREQCVNKGDCGKILIVAGSADMGGAAALSAGAAYRSGAGLVKVYTHRNNRELLLKYVPEAVALTYGDTLEDADFENLANACRWAECVVVGPGLSKDAQAHSILNKALDTLLSEPASKKCIIIDADALNMMSENRAYYKEKVTKRQGAYIVITPHMGEMSRLTGNGIDSLKSNSIFAARELSKEWGVICVLKDARTVVAGKNGVYINTTGNKGMATAGSGDVLTGIMAGMCTAGFKDFLDAVAMAVNIHGCAGDMCRERMGSRSMKAWDIVESLPEIYKYSEN